MPFCRTRTAILNLGILGFVYPADFVAKFGIGLLCYILTWASHGIKLTQGPAVLGEEDELVAKVGRKAAQWRCERTAAYRQLQAVSHMTQQLNGKSLDKYDVEGVHVGPVSPSEPVSYTHLTLPTNREV